MLWYIFDGICLGITFYLVFIVAPFVHEFLTWIFSFTYIISPIIAFLILFSVFIFFKKMKKK